MQKIALLSVVSASFLWAANGGKTSFGQEAFMPDISLIGDFSYVHRDTDIGHLNMPGFTHAHGGDDHGHEHSGLNEKEGFNLNYAELIMQSSVDNYLDLTAIFHLTENSFEVEELYGKSRGLPYGFGLKVGKFLSGFGRLNAQHYHVWDFADAALVNKAMFGEHGINEVGVALNWLAPTDFYLDIGVEFLRGANENSFGYEAVSLTEDVNLAKTSAPNLKVIYAKTGTDIADTAILAGVSYAKGEARINHLSDEENAHAFSGDSTLYGADLTVKIPFDSYSDLTWTTEYIKREMEGTRFIPNNAKDAWSKELGLSKNQSGIYSSLVYKMDNDWAMGLRYDEILENDVVVNAKNANKTDDMNKYSAMIEYNFSEYNKLRLQYNRDNSLYNEEGKHIQNNEIILQLNLAIGSHGAHSF